MFFRFIAEGVCTPQGVYIWAIERHGSLLTRTFKRTKIPEPVRLQTTRGFICFCLKKKRKLLKQILIDMRKKLVLLMILAGALIALPATAQTFGAQQAEQPNAVFQSTSTMTGSGSTYSANPTLNTDGTAAYNGAAASSGPHRAKKEDPDPFSGGTVSEDPIDTSPLGDALLPLLLMSLAFCGYLYLRRKRSAA